MAKASDVIDVELDDEPKTDLPEHAGGGDRDALMAAAMDEGVAAAGGESGEIDETRDEDAIFERLTTADELTVDDLRELGGKDAEGLSDEDLVAAYEAAEEAAKPLELPFALYDDKGEKIDTSKLDDATVQFLRDALSGKYQFGYQAMGKEQRKALNEVFRVAANGHLNETKIATTIAERNQSHEALQKLRTEHESWANDRKVWDKVIQAYAAGNVAPLQQLVQAYVAAMGQLPTADAAPATDDRALEAAGQQYVTQTLMPASIKMATEYGADANEIFQVLMAKIEAEPAEFLTQDKIDAILQYEIPSLLEQAGYSRNGTAAVAAADPRDAKLAALEAKVQELTAATANAKTATLRGKKAPAAGGGTTPAAGDSVPAMKGREDMKKWLRGEI